MVRYRSNRASNEAADTTTPDDLTIGHDVRADKAGNNAVANKEVELAATREGDILYGSKAIADFLFPEEVNRKRARRRIFNLATHYRERNKKAGFFKLSGALCLSKSQWRSFHGLS